MQKWLEHDHLFRGSELVRLTCCQKENPVVGARGIFWVGGIFGPTDLGGWSYRFTAVRPSVRLLVCPEFYSETVHKDFFDILHETSLK